MFALQQQVKAGRTAFVSQFRSARHAIEHEGFREEIGAGAFERSRLDWSEADQHAPALLLHRELLRLRREDPLFARQDLSEVDASVLNEHALVVRWFGEHEEEGDRLVVLNLGPDLTFEPCPEPLLAAPPGRKWIPILSSKEIRFGGHGAVFPDGLGTWTIQGQCGIVLTSGRLNESADETGLERTVCEGTP